MQHSLLIWLMPTFFALFAWGIGQGLVKKYIAEVSPARFCLYFVVAKALVNVGYFFSQPHPPPFAAEGLQFFSLGLLAYVLDGCAWILYFLSIVAGPITIVGTLSAAFPALTVILAWVFLGETLSMAQYFGVTLVILGCIGLSYAPANAGSKIIHRHWVIYAGLALILWGSAQVLVKYAYSLPAANDANLALYNTLGGLLTLGTYGWLFGRQKGVASTRSDWLRSFVPMGLMAAGDLFVIIALANGPSSVVTPVSGAYPLVTLIFAYLVLREHISKFHWLCVVSILLGLFLSPGG